jgi:hypothetical protein
MTGKNLYNGDRAAPLGLPKRPVMKGQLEVQDIKRATVGEIHHLGAIASHPWRNIQNDRLIIQQDHIHVKGCSAQFQGLGDFSYSAQGPLSLTRGQHGRHMSHRHMKVFHIPLPGWRQLNDGCADDFALSGDKRVD